MDCQGLGFRVSDNDLVSIVVQQAVRHWVTVLAPKRRGGRGRDTEALSFNVVVRISRVDQVLTSGATQSVGERPIVIAARVRRIAARTPGPGKRDAIVGRKD